MKTLPPTTKYNSADGRTIYVEQSLADKLFGDWDEAAEGWVSGVTFLTGSITWKTAVILESHNEDGGFEITLDPPMIEICSN